MNLRIILAVAAIWLVSLFTTKLWFHHQGWNEGQANLVEQQRGQAAAKLAKQTTRQQANDTKAAAAEQQGAARTVTITQEVVKYIKTPGRTVCTFDEARVKLKQAAADNANHIEGYDHE